MKFVIKAIYLRVMNRIFECRFKRWCKFAFHHALYPITINKEYLSKFIDWNKEWKKKYGVDL